MKKVSYLFILIVTLLISGVSVDAKTTKKKSKSSSSRIIGKFKVQDSDLTVFLHANGKVTTTDKCDKGAYEKKDEGKYYTLYYGSGGQGDCGEGEVNYLITGNDVYYIDSDHTGAIYNFIYYPNKEIIKVILDDSFQNEKEWLEENEDRGFTSLEIPLSKFEKIGTMTWIK